MNIEEKFEHSFIILDSLLPKEIIIQKNYEKYCSTFSEAYLSGSEWYIYIQSHDNNFIKAYKSCMLFEDFPKELLLLFSFLIYS